MDHQGVVSVGSGREETIKLAALTNVLLGLLTGLLALGADDLNVFYNVLGVGTVVFALALFNAWSAQRHHAERALAPGLVNVVLGLWLAASVLVLPVQSIGVFWGSITFGLLIAIFAAYSTWAGYKDRRQVHGTA